VKILFSIATVCIAAAHFAAAQDLNGSKGQGYVFFAPGFGNIGPNKANIHIGAGGEGFIYKGLAIGPEIGAVGPWSTGGIGGFSDWVVGLGSLNVSYHFLSKRSDQRFEPFVTTGYSIFFRAGVSHGANVGAGANLWLTRNLATRFEVRNQQSSWRDSTGFRVGLTFR
jgi:hypothetical protein